MSIGRREGRHARDGQFSMSVELILAFSQKDGLLY